MSAQAEAVEIRAHTLLCIQGFVGKGYSPEFVANMREVIARLEPETPVRVTAAPDVICAACPNLSGGGCELHGPGSEEGIVRQDRDVARRLSIEPGDAVSWSEIVDRVRNGVDPDDLDSICGRCPWLPLGVCKGGLTRLQRFAT